MKAWLARWLRRLVAILEALADRCDPIVVSVRVSLPESARVAPGAFTGPCVTYVGKVPDGRGRH
jgi:hypothetical protein